MSFYGLKSNQQNLKLRSFRRVFFTFTNNQNIIEKAITVKCDRIKIKLSELSELSELSKLEQECVP